MPSAAERAAKRASRNEVEQKPEPVEAMAAHELNALVVGLEWLDVDAGVVGIVRRSACVDGLQAQRTDLMVTGPACLERGYLCADGFRDGVVLQQLLQALDHRMLPLDHALVARNLLTQLIDFPLLVGVLELHLKHISLESALLLASVALHRHEASLPFACRRVHFYFKLHGLFEI